MLFQRIAVQSGEGNAAAGNRGALGYSANAHSASRRMLDSLVAGDEGHSGSFDRQWSFVERSGPNRSPAA
jgi:hypothetical protein